MFWIQNLIIGRQLLIAFVLLSLTTASYGQTTPNFEWWFNGNLQSAIGNVNISGTNDLNAFTTDRFNLPDAAYVFDGSRYITIDNENGGLDFIARTGVFTISTWVNITNGTGHKLFGATNDQGGYFLAVRDTYVEFRLFGPSGVVSRAFTSNAVVNSSSGWKNIMVRGNGSSIGIFIDGQLKGNATIDGPLSSQIELPLIYLGAQRRYSSPAGISHAIVDDFKVFDNALTGQQIEDIYQSETIAPSETPVYDGWLTGSDGLYSQDRISIGGNSFSSDNSFQLSVQKSILTEGVKVARFENWPDYVFDSNYPLLSLKDTEIFINRKKHLPGIPSAAEVANQGFRLEEMNALLLKKIEELTLHLITLEKSVKQLEQKVDQHINPSDKKQ